MTRRTSAGRPTPARQIPARQFEHQPELRALMLLPTLPPGHMTFRVEDDAFYPHLRRGEFAVVDLADHEPADGELFLISYGTPYTECGLTFAICRMSASAWFQGPDGAYLLKPAPGRVPATLWMAAHWIPPHDPQDYAAALRSGRVSASEGPFTAESVAKKLVGRIVGVWLPGR